MNISSIDTGIVAGLNDLLVGSGTGNQLFRMLVYNIGENPLLRGIPVFVPLLLLWFKADNAKQQSRILTGLIATCFAVFVSVSTQYLVHIHTRPVLNPSLDLLMSTSNWDHQSSFPSDTAMLYFALSSTIALLNRRTGAIAFTWSLLSAGFCRVALGWHYPSDILGSLIIAPAIVLLFDRWPALRHLLERLLEALQNRMYLLNALLALFIAEAYNLFPGLRSIVETLVRIARNRFDLPGL